MFNGGVYFRTLSEARREHGLPTVDDLRRQFPRRFCPELIPKDDLFESSGTKVEVKGRSVLKRPRKDLGEPIESTVEHLNVAATDTASVTEAEVEGGSVRKRQV